MDEFIQTLGLFWEIFSATPVPLILVVVFIGTTILSSAWLKGLSGEFLVRVATDFFLDGDLYHPLHNTILPTLDGTTQIDHIIVSPFGVFVIETKNMKGWIFGDAYSKHWTQSLYRKKYSFQNPLLQNFKHVKAVEHHLQIPVEHIHSVVVFVSSSRFKTPMPANVLRLTNFLRYVRSKTLVVFDDSERAAISRRLNLVRSDKIGDGIAHVRGLKRNAEKPICPKCGGQLVRRTARKGRARGSEFWGCSGFPKCRFTRRIP